MNLTFHNTEVADEHGRWLDIASSEHTDNNGISVQDVLGVHFLIVDMFYGKREGLGGIGPKDLGLLSSAVSRQHTGFGDFEKWPSIEDKAATLLYGIVLNHPFHDANKRTGFLTTLYYLQRNGRYPRVTAQQFEDFVVTVADRSFRKNEEVSEFVCRPRRRRYKVHIALHSLSNSANRQERLYNYLQRT